MMYDDDNGDDRTQFEPTPWGARQRVLPRRTFKAVASVVAQLPVIEQAPVTAQSLAARVASMPAEAPRFGTPVVCEADIPTWRVPKMAYETPSFGTPIVREADIPTWRVPKMPLYPAKPTRYVEARRWVPIFGPLAIVIIALLGARLAGGDLHADATSISAAMLAEPSDGGFHIVANVEEPPAAVEAPAPHRMIALASAKHASRVKHASKRPLLAVDVATPLGDLARQRHR